MKKCDIIRTDIMKKAIDNAKLPLKVMIDNKVVGFITQMFEREGKMIGIVEFYDGKTSEIYMR